MWCDVGDVFGMGVFGGVFWFVGSGCGVGFGGWLVIDSGLGVGFYCYGWRFSICAGWFLWVVVMVVLDSKVENMCVFD